MLRTLKRTIKKAFKRADRALAKYVKPLVRQEGESAVRGPLNEFYYDDLEMLERLKREQQIEVAQKQMEATREKCVAAVDEELIELAKQIEEDTAIVGDITKLSNKLNGGKMVGKIYEAGQEDDYVEPIGSKVEKAPKKRTVEAAMATLADRGMHPRVVHNVQARVSLAYDIKINTDEKADGRTATITCAFFACNPKDVWIRSRGFQGAIKRLARSKPDTGLVFTVYDRAYADAKLDIKKLDAIVRQYVKQLTVKRIASALFAELTLAFIEEDYTVLCDMENSGMRFGE